MRSRTLIPACAPLARGSRTASWSRACVQVATCKARCFYCRIFRDYT